ncbi:MAG: aquaporin [Acholeplasmataceae bacterium]|jgi:aquaporin Z|nr:aquaporin [Acholeplasmataceae bacterium]
MLKKIVAEGFGTFGLVFIGTATAVLTGNIVATAIAFGLAFTTMHYIVGPLSGGHFNPATSLAMWIKKKLETKDLGLYLISQVVGAILGSLLLFILLGSNAQATGMGANQIGAAFAGNSMAIVVALIVEIVLSFVFVLLILRVQDDEATSSFRGLIIGLVLTMIVVAGFAFTGASVNPARSLAPAIFAAGEPLKQVWIFIVAPLVGGALAGLMSIFLEKE